MVLLCGDEPGVILEGYMHTMVDAFFPVVRASAVHIYYMGRY